MQTILQTLVFIVQLAVGGFVFSAWTGPAKALSFERVASLVLLALLCTTIAALG